MTEPAEVVMRHRTLPGQPIVIPAAAVEGHEAAGWYVAKTDPDAVPDPPTVPIEDRQAEPDSTHKEK
jgi:hypothetical protein